jgi:hypothetical protein
MDNLRALGRGTQLMFVSAVLLVIISFFRWQEVSVSLGAIGSVSGGRNALHGFWGWLMFLLTIVLIARVAARLAAVEIPIPLSFATTSFVLGILIAVSAVLKVITDDYTKFWAYIGVVLAILVAVGAWLEVKEAGGMEHLRSQATSVAGAASAAASSASTGQASSAEPPAPPAPPATPEAAPPPAEATGGGAVGDATQEAEAASGSQESAGADTGDAPAATTDESTSGPSTGSGA